MKYLKGINRDVGPTAQPEGTYRFANNAVLKKDYGAIANESGTNEFPSTVYIIGECSLDNGDFILFEADQDPTGDHYINRYDKNGVFLNTVLHRNDLNFSTLFPIKAVSKRVADEYIVYWTDNNNKPAVLNIARQETANTTVPFNDSLIYGSIIKDINNLSLMSYSGSVPVITSATVEEGGNLQTGTYYLALAYMGLDRVTTNYVTISNAVYVPGSKDTYAWTNIVGSPSGIPSNKQIVFHVGNLNTTFEFLQPVILRRAGGGYDAFKLTVQTIEAAVDIVTFSGSENYSTASPAEVIIDYPVYDKAKALEIVDSVLYLGNLEGSLDVGYQPYANAIELEATTKIIHNYEDIDFVESTLEDNVVKPLNKNSYRHAHMSYMYKGYTREEVYAFYIVWVLKDGRETYGYHIPGRTSSNNDNELDLVTNPTTVLEKQVPNVFNFHMNSWIDNSNYVNNMGYWENQDERYPISDNYETLDVSVVGNPIASSKPDLAGEAVRHHHFPSNNTCDDNTNDLNPIISNSVSSSFTTGVDIVDEVAPVNWNYAADPTNIDVRDSFGQTPPMGNRIEISTLDGLIFFEPRNIADDATGATPYYSGPQLPPGSSTDWGTRLAGQDWIEFFDWQTGNASPTADETNFLNAMNAVGPFHYGGLSGSTPPGSGPLQCNSFVHGWTDPYGFMYSAPGTTPAQIVANPQPHHWALNALGSASWCAPGAWGVHTQGFAYKPGVNDHNTCSWGGGTMNGLWPYGVPSCPVVSAPPCACGSPTSGTPYHGRKEKAIYYKQWYNGPMPNYLQYDISFKIRWVGSGVAQTSTTYTSPGPAPSDLNILGFHLNNVKVPSDIADTVQGFRVYRAERDWKNKRVWGQSPAISMRAVGGYDPNQGGGSNVGVVSPWPKDETQTDFIPSAAGGNTMLPYKTSGSPPKGAEYGDMRTVWVRTANPESLEQTYQSDKGNPTFFGDPAQYDIKYPNAGFALYDFTLLRQLKNIRPVSYLSLVHYTRNQVFSTMHNLGVVHNTAHCAMEFIPSEENRMIRNRAITYQGAADLIGAKGLGFTQEDIIGSGFDNEAMGKTNAGYTSITCQISPNGTENSGSEIYFTHPSTGQCKGWEEHPSYNQDWLAYNTWSFDPYTRNYPMMFSQTLQANGAESMTPIVNLSSLKYNVYSRWNTQKLIQTGYYCPIDNFDPRNPTATFSTKDIYPDGIFGGDTFICRVGYRAGHMDNYGEAYARTTGSNVIRTNIYSSFSASHKRDNPPPLQYKALYCTMAESTDNINFRYEHYDNSNNLYKAWPASSAQAVVNQPLTFDLNNQVGHAYDEVYSADNDVRYAIAFPFIDDTMDKFPNRIIKSNVDAQTKIDANRVFLANDYKDISTSKGPINELLNLSNLLYIHCDRSLFATKGKQTVQLTDTSEAFIGSGDIFQQEPQEVISVDHGYGGRQSIFGGVSTRYGYFFMDKEAGKVFQFDGELNEISKLGLEKTFKELAGSPLSVYGVPADSPLRGFGVSLGWDPKYDRLLVTINTVSPTATFLTGISYNGPLGPNNGDGAIAYYPPTGYFRVFRNDGGVPNWITLEYSNTGYFNQDHITISYYPEFKMWGSFHDYHPFMYFNNYTKFFSHPGVSGSFFDHLADTIPGNFYAGQTPAVQGIFEFEYVVNPQPEQSKLFYNVHYDVQVKNSANNPEHDSGFDSYYVYNSKQICQETQILHLVNARVVDTSVILNQLRDDTDFTTGNLPNFTMFTNNLTGAINNSYIDAAKTDLNRSRFVDKYLIIRLKYSNSTNNLLNLYSANAGYRQNHR